MAQNFKRNKKQVEEAKRKKRLEKASKRAQKNAGEASPVEPSGFTPPQPE